MVIRQVHMEQEELIRQAADLSLKPQVLEP
jgi:hypothetical protein